MSYSNRSREEDARALDLLDLALESIPKFGADWSVDSAVFLRRQAVSRILFFSEIYRRIITVPGVILEFGCRRGGTLSVLTNCRGIYEPYNFTRKIYGFDTFTGFTRIHAKDEQKALRKTNKIREKLFPDESDLSVEAGWSQKLERILSLIKLDSPLQDLQTTEIVVGDVSETWVNWRNQNPGMVVSLAILDMDIYEPTKKVLENILDIMPKGAILLFDEFNYDLFPGETVAVLETLGLDIGKWERSPLHPTAAFCVL